MGFTKIIKIKGENIGLDINQLKEKRVGVEIGLHDRINAYMVYREEGKVKDGEKGNKVKE